MTAPRQLYSPQGLIDRFDRLRCKRRRKVATNCKSSCIKAGEPLREMSPVDEWKIAESRQHKQPLSLPYTHTDKHDWRDDDDRNAHGSPSPSALSAADIQWLHFDICICHDKLCSSRVSNLPCPISEKASPIAAARHWWCVIYIEAGGWFASEGALRNAKFTSIYTSILMFQFGPSIHLSHRPCEGSHHGKSHSGTPRNTPNGTHAERSCTELSTSPGSLFAG